jgi:hypothetical protein
MSFDISHLLEQWDYEPGRVVVRRFVGKDGQEKIQLRVDLGLLQMNAQGRPDGKRPLGCPSWFDFYLSRLNEHRAKHGDAEGFTLQGEDCTKLQLEALQYHHRSICLLELADHAATVRDTERNLKVFDFVAEHAPAEELAWSLEQFRPQVLLLHTRATASRELVLNRFTAALARIEEGLERLREFYRAHSRHDLLEHSMELQSLQQWQEEIRNKRPRSRREQLEQDLEEAVRNEDYERAARVRDQLRTLKPSE